MARTEHYNEPAAPKANRIVVAVTAFVLDEAGRLLLIQRSDNGLWALPGGAQDFGEYVAETAVRETKEETGIDTVVIGLVGIYSNPTMSSPTATARFANSSRSASAARQLAAASPPAPSRPTSAGFGEKSWTTLLSIHRCDFASTTA